MDRADRQSLHWALGAELGQRGEIKTIILMMGGEEDSDVGVFFAECDLA